MRTLCSVLLLAGCVALTAFPAWAEKGSLFIEQVPSGKRAVPPPGEAANVPSAEGGILDCETKHGDDGCRGEVRLPSLEEEDRNTTSTIPIIPGVTINQPPPSR